MSSVFKAISSAQWRSNKTGFYGLSQSRRFVLNGALSTASASLGPSRKQNCALFHSYSDQDVTCRATECDLVNSSFPGYFSRAYDSLSVN